MGTTSNWVDGLQFRSACYRIDSTVSPSGITLTSNQTGATYQWLDCDNGFLRSMAKLVSRLQPLQMEIMQLKLPWAIALKFLNVMKSTL